MLKMKINKSNFYTILFMIVIFLQLYLPSFKANIFFQIGVLVLYFFIEKSTISLGFFKVLVPVICIFFLGFLGTLINKYSLYEILKDIFHFLKPILGLLIGYLFFTKINDFKLFVKTIVIAGLISALIHIILVAFFSRTETVSDLRELGKDNFLELFALFFLGYYKKFKLENLFKSKTVFKIIFFVPLLSCVLYFSRTMIVIAILLFLSVYGFTKITRTTIKIITIFTFLIIIFYAYLFSIKLDRNGNSLESFLYKVQIAPSEILKTKIDRENHKDLWDHWRGYEAKRAFALMEDNPSSFVFGCGHGSLVNLKFNAPLTNNKHDKGLRYISELHNGYPYILYKTGVIGLFFYLVFLIGFYKKIYRPFSMESIFISAIGLMFLFSTLTITGIYNSRDIVVFILGALLYFERIVSKNKILE
jgi:hypothetical protein